MTIETQTAEFDAVKELARQMRRIELTPIVDDDYMEVRTDYETAVQAVMDAFAANGRARWKPAAEVKFDSAARLARQREFSLNNFLARELAKGALHVEWGDTEIAARRVAEHCAHVISAFRVEITQLVLTRPFDFAAHLARQREFSMKTFGPGARTKGVVDHIRKELREVLDSVGQVTQLEEWIDCVILALDGAWRCGTQDDGSTCVTPEMIIQAIVSKQAKNERRVWPDYRTVEPNKAIEHVRSGGVSHAYDYWRGSNGGPNSVRTA